MKQFNDIYNDFESFLKSDVRAFVVTGESGSGKSTCAMHVAYKAHKAHSGLPIFEYRERSGSLVETAKSLKKYVDGKLCILLMDDLHVYAEDVADVMSDGDFAFMRILSSARLSDWHGKIASQLSETRAVELRRFQSADIEGIITKLLENVPAPAFKRLSQHERVERLRRSRRQLLIALKEATESRGFNDIIDDEFARVKDDDSRFLFLTIAIPTMARAGILESAVETMYGFSARSAVFSEAKKQLSGMIDLGTSGRIQARHEIYASHVFHQDAELAEVKSALDAVLSYFARFEIPVIKHVPKLDGQVFKYVLNNKFIYDLFVQKHKRPDLAEEYYERFGIPLQLDGHFWLQYGLLLRRLGQQERAYEHLLKSVQAYPENAYAHHALAQQKLIAARQRGRFDEVCRRLVDEAVDHLMKRHYVGEDRVGRPLDEYPLVTLSFYHIDTLHHHGRISEAKKYAKQYFRMIQDAERARHAANFGEAKARLLLLTVSDTWEPVKYKRGDISFI